MTAFTAVTLFIAYSWSKGALDSKGQTPQVYQSEAAPTLAQSKAAATKEDLMTRLSNAVKQRDAAREEALLAVEKLNKLQEDMEAGVLLPPAAPAPAQPSASPATAALTPPAYPGGATEPGEFRGHLFAVSCWKEQFAESSLSNACCGASWNAPCFQPAVQAGIWISLL